MGNQKSKNTKNADTKEKNEGKKTEEEKHREDRIENTGQVTLDKNDKKHKIHLITIIGEVEGHDNLNGTSKTKKYEHILPELAAIEDSCEVDGLLILLNTMGGDVEAGLAIAEMIASLSKPTVSLVLGGSHSIGVPIAASTDYSYFKQIQNRITGFVCSHCKISKTRLEELMMETGVLTKDVGTILVGQEAVNEGIINEVGGIKEAMQHLHEMIGDK